MTKVHIAQNYRCTRDHCRAFQMAGATMYQTGKAFICGACHEADLAKAEPEARICVVCEKPCDPDEDTCSRRCRRRLERDSNRHADRVA